ncbi:MAG: hypothetical protein P3B98_04850 [Gemmatimonadota bacterium]|nr:hypothetical protein [Gemmatimonadota bacterium]
MLTYLDSLCDSLATRDLPRIRHLVVDHPLARLLPAEAMAEARRFLADKAGPHAVPLANLRFRDQTARLLSEHPHVEATPATMAPATMPALTVGQPAVGAPSAAEGSPQTLRVERPHRRRRRVAAAQTELPLSA